MSAEKQIVEMEGAQKPSPTPLVFDVFTRRKVEWHINKSRIGFNTRMLLLAGVVFSAFAHWGLETEMAVECPKILGLFGAIFLAFTGWGFHKVKKGYPFSDRRNLGVPKFILRQLLIFETKMYPPIALYTIFTITFLVVANIPFELLTWVNLGLGVLVMVVVIQAIRLILSSLEWAERRKNNSPLAQAHQRIQELEKQLQRQEKLNARLGVDVSLAIRIIRESRVIKGDSNLAWARRTLEETLKQLVPDETQRDAAMMRGIRRFEEPPTPPVHRD